MEEENKKRVDNNRGDKKEFAQKAKTFFKWLIIAFVVFTLVTFVGAKLYDYQQEQKDLAYLAELERPYKEDMYGGATPEETFAMFLDALKDGDVDLASKYFILEKQVEWNGFFEEVVKNGKLEKFISYFNNGIIYTGSLYDGNQQYEIRDKNDIIIFGLVDFVKYPSGVWKLTEL